MPMLENQTEKKMEHEIETREASEDLRANVQRARPISRFHSPPSKMFGPSKFTYARNAYKPVTCCRPTSNCCSNHSHV